jgi:hypothetical protein
MKRKEHYEKMLESTDAELKKSFKNSKITLINNPKPIKYSEIFHKFMGPLIKVVIDDEESIKGILAWGQLIWNKAVADKFPENSKSKDVKRIFPLFEASFGDHSLIKKFINRKNKLFNDADFFILKQTSLLDNRGGLSISVAVSPLAK